MIASKLALIESYLREIPQIKVIHQSYVDPANLGHNFPAIILVPTGVDSIEIPSGGQEIVFTMHFSIYIYISNVAERLMLQLEDIENRIIQKMYAVSKTDCDLHLMSLEDIDFGEPYDPFGLEPTINPPFAIEQQNWIVLDSKWLPSGEY